MNQHQIIDCLHTLWVGGFISDSEQKRYKSLAAKQAAGKPLTAKEQDDLADIIAYYHGLHAEAN